MTPSLIELESFSSDKLHRQVDAVRRQFGKRLLILGHHYQKEEVVIHTDLRGDSFQLSAEAAANADCKTIVFCGVHFMAETADILANADARRVDVVIPDAAAGCSMADMATREQVELAWSRLAEFVDVSDIVPVTYVNSSAQLKAFCGRNGGVACTSTNARAVLDWAFAQKRRVFFFPDQHLGRNTALAMGLPESEIVLWSGGEPSAPDAIRNARIILWNGYCGIHQKFRPEHITAIRRSHPRVRVIVHPECCREVVELADESGSTSRILDRIAESSADSQWAVGTESRLVERLVSMFPTKTIFNLSPQPSYCETMDLITLPKLTRSLLQIEAGTPENVVRVDTETARDAIICLQRMLSCR